MGSSGLHQILGKALGFRHSVSLILYLIPILHQSELTI
jgi:hypothetical protein